MWMSLTRQQLPGILPRPFWLQRPYETAVVQEELEQA